MIRGISIDGFDNDPLGDPLRDPLGNVINHYENQSIKRQEKIKEKKESIASNTPVTFNGRLYLRSRSTLQEMDGMAAHNFLLGKMGISWDAFKDAELEIPTFVEEFSGVTANIKREMFYAIQHGARIDDRTGKVVKAIYDTNDDIEKLSERQRLILQCFSSDDIENDIENVTENASSIAPKKIGVSLRTIMRDIEKLKQLGLVEHVGPDKGGYWRVLTRK